MNKVAKLLLMLCVCSCTTIPDRRYAIQSISIEGNDDLDSDELEESIASQESPRFLGVFGGVVYDYEVFNRYVLEADLQRIERYYRARGYYRARVRAGRVEHLGGRRVEVQIFVEEGPPVLVQAIQIEGLQAVPLELAQDARDAVGAELEVGDLFDEDTYEDTADVLRRALTDNGYAHARVERSAQVDLPTNTARLHFQVSPGPLTRFGEVSIEGLGSIPEEPVRLALDLSAGELYSEGELEAAERAVLDLGVFSSVNVKPDLPRRRWRDRGKHAETGRHEKGQQTREPLPTRVPVRVTVERSKLRSVRLGGGLHADTLRTDVHLTAGWEHYNLFGGLQHFLVELVPGVVLYPTRIPSLQPPDRLLPEARVRSELRQPGFLEARTNALLRTEASAYPVLLTADPAPDAPILGYQDLRVSAGVERRHRRLYGALSQNVQLNRPFTYAGERDPDLGSVVVSYPELLTTLDLRDDPIQPHTGVYVENRLQAAGVGGDAVDVKIEPEARFFIPLGRKLTFATRGALGFLFARNYGQTVLPNATTGQPGGVSRTEWVQDVQLMFLRGLFSGGATSNRGYRIREIGPHGIVPFYNPGQSAEAIVGGCAPGGPNVASSECQLPLGGFTLWEATAELRFPIMGALRGAVFCDTSDVAPEKLQFRFDHPHLSLGAGIRYATPVGPVRLDVGYRVPGLQAPKNAPDEGNPDDIWGMPIAVALGIGAPF